MKRREFLNHVCTSSVALCTANMLCDAKTKDSSRQTNILNEENYNLTSTVMLTKDGRYQATIIVPEDASQLTLFAAHELRRYVHKISGAEIPISTENDSHFGTPVYIGGTEVSKKLRPELPEEIGISVRDRSVIITGGDERTVVYGVYRFLEEVLGCRWLARDIDYVPHMPTITLEPVNISSAPVFEWRWFKAHRAGSAEWGFKLGMNGIFRRHIPDIVNNGTNPFFYFPTRRRSHAHKLIIPADKYFDKHPEWFAKIDGERKRPKRDNYKLCVTAEGLADEFASRVIEYFDADPHLKVLPISPNDGRYGWCECAQCIALDKRLNGRRKTKQGLRQAELFMGDRVFWFANEVAKRVKKVHPDKKLLHLAYINYAEPPDTVVPKDNVVPWLAHFAPADYAKPINDPASAPNRQFNTILKDWVNIKPDLLFYAYASKSMWWSLPRPVVHPMSADIKHFHSLGVSRYYAQSTLADWQLDGPLYYVLSKLLWDPSKDPEELVADWTDHMFGKVAEDMKEYYSAIKDSIPPDGVFSETPPAQVPGLYKFEELDRAKTALKSAKNNAEDKEIIYRVQQIDSLFEYQYLMIEFLEYVARFDEEASKEIASKALSKGQAALNKLSELGRRAHRSAERLVKQFKMIRNIGARMNRVGEPEHIGGRLCYNTNHTGPDVPGGGWATFTVPVSDRTRPVKLKIDVWGISDLDTITVNSCGTGASRADGGEWTRITPRNQVSGQEQWDTLVYEVPAEAMYPDQKQQLFGVGGGDRQIWISEIRIFQ